MIRLILSKDITKLAKSMWQEYKIPISCHWTHHTISALDAIRMTFDGDVEYIADCLYRMLAVPTYRKDYVFYLKRIKAILINDDKLVKLFPQ